jgi:HEPN domain-containing protein
VPAPDPPDDQDWLNRLSAPQWLAAAENEIAQGDVALGRRAIRPAVTHARRAAGMALNAILRLGAGPARRAAWGRSYMEHVVALASDQDVPSEVQAAAALLRDTPPQAPPLVQLGAPDRRFLDAARRIADWVRAEVGNPPSRAN